MPASFRIIMLAVFFTLIFVHAAPAQAQNQDEVPVLDDFELVWEAMDTVYIDRDLAGPDWDAGLRATYRADIEAAPDAQAAYAILEDLVEQLGDEATYVIPPWDIPAAPEDVQEAELEYAGVGILISELESGEIIILQVFRDAPAEAAGVLVGDLIVGVDDWEPTADHGVSDVSERVRGPVGSPVQLTLEDPDGDLRTVEVVRGQIDLRPSVEHRFVESGIAYMRMPALTTELVGEGARALPSLLNARGLVLDLRGVGGGSVDGMSRAAQWFLGATSLGEFVGRDGPVAFPYRPDAVAAYRGPLVVLTDGRTGGVAEVLALLLQEYGRARIVGNHSQGGFDISSAVDLPSGGVLRLVVARYVSPAGHQLPVDGVQPDMELPIPDLEELRQQRDTFLEQAVELLQE